MHGRLRTRSVSDVCRELAAEHATGVLQLSDGDSTGRVVFEGGRLVAASSPTLSARLGDRLVHAGLLEQEDLDRVLAEQRATPEADRARLGHLLVESGLVPIDAVRLLVQEQLLDALLDLTSWRDGNFRFDSEAEPDTPEVPLAAPVDQVLVEVARRRREWQAISEVIPGLDTVPRFREGANSARAPLEPDEFAVLASVDGSRSIRELAEDLGYGEFDAARVVYGLHLLGLVEMADAEASEEGAEPTAAEAGDNGPRPPVETGTSAVGPAEAEVEHTLEADLPDLSAFEELRLAEDEPPPSVPADAEAATPDASAEEPVARRRPAADADVSELLRELSRLSVEDDEDEAPADADEPAAPPARPRAPAAREEPRRRKRGLFGFGG